MEDSKITFTVLPLYSFSYLCRVNSKPTALNNHLSFTRALTFGKIIGWLLPSMVLSAPLRTFSVQCLVLGHFKHVGSIYGQYIRLLLV